MSDLKEWFCYDTGSRLDDGQVAVWEVFYEKGEPPHDGEIHVIKFSAHNLLIEELRNQMSDIAKQRDSAWADTARVNRDYHEARQDKELIGNSLKAERIKSARLVEALDAIATCVKYPGAYLLAREALVEFKEGSAG